MSARVVIRLLVAVVASIASVALSWPYWRDFEYWPESRGMWALYFAVGFVLSLAAAQVNWGAVFLAEPRVAGALRGLAVALLVQVANAWLPWPRVGIDLRRR